MKIEVTFFVVVVATVAFVVDSANLTHSEILYETLFTKYNKYLYPVLNLDEPILIDTTAFVVSINKFDEINGEFEVTCAFTLIWKDERLTWTPTEYGGKQSFLLPHDLVWRPLLSLMQSYDHFQMVGNASQLVRIYSNGTIVWVPANVFKVICSVDVTYFPFDSQTCHINVSTWSFTKDELRFVIRHTDVDLSLLSSNSQWNVISVSVSNSSCCRMNYDSINLKMVLDRRSDFFVVYIIIPILFLGLINICVFLMPASSGERNSVAITAFLSFVVFMEMVNSNVPESSSPLAYLYYYMLFMLVYSSAILILSIVSLRIYDRDNTVPTNVVKAIKYLRFWKLKCTCRAKPNNNAVTDLTNDEKEIEKDVKDFENDIEAKADPSDESEVINWKIVGKTYDKYCGFILGVVYIFFTALTFGRLYSNQGL
ncbi:hypothetical protein ACF0H5_018052 [Mactra antiquata]